MVGYREWRRLARRHSLGGGGCTRLGSAPRDVQSAWEGPTTARSSPAPGSVRERNRAGPRFATTLPTGGQHENSRFPFRRSVKFAHPGAGELLLGAKRVQGPCSHRFDGTGPGSSSIGAMVWAAQDHGPYSQRPTQSNDLGGAARAPRTPRTWEIVVFMLAVR